MEVPKEYEWMVDGAKCLWSYGKEHPLEISGPPFLRGNMWVVHVFDKGSGYDGRIVERRCDELQGDDLASTRSTGHESVGFRVELETLINRFSMENGSNTPDFILALFLLDCLLAFDKVACRREKWYGRVQEECLLGENGEKP